MRRKDEVQTENDIEFREIQADSMSEDLRIIYRTKFAPRCIICEITLLISVGVILFAYLCNDNGISLNDSIILIQIIGLTVAFSFITVLLVLALPAKLFERKHSEVLPMIERSYMNGKMLLHASFALNIGDDYLVFVKPTKCIYIKLSNIMHAGAVRDWEWRNFKDKPNRRAYNIALFLRDRQKTVLLKLDRYETDYLCDELDRLGVNITKAYD